MRPCIVVCGATAYGPFTSPSQALDWISTSSLANESYSVLPLVSPDLFNAIAEGM